MARFSFLCLFGCLVVLLSRQGLAQQPDSTDLGNKAKDSALSMSQRLYVTLRNIAFPDHPLTGTKSSNIENRFLLLMPGKVLNYFDYYPGKEYTKFIQDYNPWRRESVVPPHVMEKWFDLADAMPSSNPLNGQDTGKSLANVYRSILHEIKLKGLEEKTTSDKHLYNQGIQFLNRQVEDPEDLTKNVTRLSLYERFRDEYNKRKLEMEDQIEDKRQNLGSLNYELWFQRHYPSLQSQVESAYTKWMVFGQKELLELNIAYLDTGSSGLVIEQARMSLRASGVESLDRTRTLYPVSFEPSDWYKYLLPEQRRPSRDQLQIMLAKLKSRLDAIQAMIDYVNGIPLDGKVEHHINDLQSIVDSARNTANQTLTKYLNDMYLCMTDNTGNGTDCQNYDKDRDATLKALIAQADAHVSSESMITLTKRNGVYIESLKAEASRLQDESAKIYSLLGEASPYLGGIIDSSSLAIANLTDEYKDDEWLQFQFNSASSYQQTDEFNESVSTSSHFGGGFLFFGGSGSSSSQTDTRTHQNRLATSNLRAKGELLRVNIKRPWFKPEVFDDPSLTYRESDESGDKTYVSPARGNNEVQYYNTLINSKNRYKLPEFTTSFLLARNIELEFSGLDSATSTYYLSQVTHKSYSGGFFFFHASHSETRSKQVSHVTAARTADGLSIKIPGAQLIGYYTQTLPRFPQDQQ